jgi:hypothetical protein
MDPPSTPFQILYFDHFTRKDLPIFEDEIMGILTTGSNTFTVPAGKMFYVPIESVDDSPLVVEPFPTSPSQAKRYWVDPSLVGATGTSRPQPTIVVDGKITLIPPDYLVGPITTVPLLDGGGTHIITLGVFLMPLTKGSHTVEVQGKFAGTQLVETFGMFFEEDFTYTVIVE